MSAALIISVVAILIALFSLKLSYRADHREAGREEREVEASGEQRRGKPVVIPRGGSFGGSPAGTRHEYEIRNTGQSTITDLKLWIEDAGGERVSTLAGGEGFVLAPNGPPAFTGVDVPEPIPYEQTLMISWTDADGDHGPESTRIHPQRYA